MANKSALVVGLGEVLWDLLPTGRQLGGAPANFAYISSLLGDRAAVVSCVGNDDLGREALARVEELGLDAASVQTDPTSPTGTVNVTLDDQGQPAFTITDNVAWDNIQWNDQLQQLALQADVVCFGTLAQRRDPSRSTVQKFLRSTRESCLRIFDVNLRQPYYSPVVLKTGFAQATVAKLNDQELPIVLTAVGLPTSDDQTADCESLLEHFGLELVCLTRGAHGSLLVSKERKSQHPGFRVKVVDAVGAGDAFTAAFAHQLRRGASLDDTNEFANRVASWVASQSGATPSGLPDDIIRILTGVS